MRIQVVPLSGCGGEVALKTALGIAQNTSEFASNREKRDQCNMFYTIYERLCREEAKRLNDDINDEVKAIFSH